MTEDLKVDIDLFACCFREAMAGSGLLKCFQNPVKSFDLFPQAFEVQASTDNENWVNLFTVENYSPPSSRSESWTHCEAIMPGPVTPKSS